VNREPTGPHQVADTAGGLVGSATDRDHVGPRDVLGVPVLPPARVSGIGNRLRAGLARAHRATAPPPARLLEGALGGLDLAALTAMCRLELPDRLTGPTDLSTLADQLRVDAARLDRLVRYAATRGWLRLDRRRRVRPTRVTAFLRRDHPGGWRAWVDFAAGAEVAAALASLDAGLRPDGDAFAAGNQQPFFPWMAAHPARHATFDGAMAAGGRMHGLLLAGAIDWSRSRRVCDVGGGDGALLGVLLAQHDHLHGVVLELPEVVARAPQRARMTAIAGDAFAAVPSGCDTYLFVNVLHDWDDVAAVRLLGRARSALDTTEVTAAAEAAATARRIVVVESEAHERPRDDLAVRADLLMLALTPGGRERTTAEITALASQAGLRRERTVRLASGDAAHVLVR
jgi:hypothetical protein